MNQRIIIVGEQGVGKSQLAALIAAGSGLPVVEEWDGQSDLPDQCIAVSNLGGTRSFMRLFDGALLLNVAAVGVAKPSLPAPVAEVTVTGNVSDLKKSILADA
jgi:hypothetical protein